MVGSDFFLAFSPERVDPGNRRFTTANIPKVVGGLTPACTRLAATLYRAVKGTVFEASSPRVAETAKLIRKQLKAKFPAVKFSVKSSRYSGGSSIDICWEDGPTSKAVDVVVQPFCGGRFDGMIDMQSHRRHWLTP